VKILARRIDMLASFVENDKPHPIRFRIKEKDSEERKVIKVEKIISITDNKNAGKLSYIYLCQSEIYGELRQYELKYKINECKWELYKM